MPDPSIHRACQIGDIDAVRRCIAEDPACVDADDEYEWRPIFHAGLHQHEAIVRLLIDAGADLSAHDGYVMHYAGEVPGNKPIVAMLVEHGALDAHVRPADDLSRQFLAAVFLGKTERVRALAQLHPHLPIAKDGRGDLPIHHAARNGDADIVELLFEAGCDVNQRGHDGNTPLYCAGGHGHTDAVRVLLLAGADPDASINDKGETLLEWLRHYEEEPHLAGVAEVLREHR